MQKSHLLFLSLIALLIAAHRPERAPSGLLVRMPSIGGVENAACFSYPLGAKFYQKRSFDIYIIALWAVVGSFPKDSNQKDEVGESMGGGESDPRNLKSSCSTVVDQRSSNPE